MSRYSGLLPRDYNSALRMLNGKRSRKVLNNTVIRTTLSGDAVVEYHGNEIARFYANGEVLLTNCGYGTTSTRARLNAMSPARYGFVQRDYEQMIVDASTGTETVGGSLYLVPDEFGDLVAA